MIRTTLILLLISLTTQARQIVPIGDKFYMEVKKGEDLTLKVYSKKTNTLLISRKEIKKPDPYDVKTLFMYQDFNFDGHSDLALYTDQSFCQYKGNYDVYLWQKEKFVYHEQLSNIINLACDPFEFDTAKHLLLTKHFNQCCLYEEEFRIEGSKVERLKTIIHRHNNFQEPVIYNETTIEYLNNKETEESKDYLNGENIYSFTLKKNKKQVVLSDFDNKLYYGFLAPDNSVEMYYPTDNSNFTIKNQVLSFKVGNIVYEISPTGVQVKMNGKTYDMPADETTIKGDWDKIRQYNNVTKLD